jgi:hypothetical protein
MPPKKRVTFTADFLAFRGEFNKRAASFGCSRMPQQIGMQKLYFRATQLVEQYEEAWPTWEQVEAGVKGMAAFGFVPKNPGWYLSHKGEGKYPNILSCVGHGEAKATDADETPKVPIYSEGKRGC